MGFIQQLTGSDAKKKANELHKQNTAEIATGESEAHANLGLGRNALTEGRTGALAGLGTGYEAANTRWDEANLAGNSAAQKLYLDAIGANGPGAQEAAVSRASNDPFLKYNMDNALTRSMAKYAATGDSGNARIAAQRAMQDVGSDTFRWNVGELGKAGAQGYDVAAQRAGIDMGYGRDVAGVHTGWGKDTAGLYGADAELDWAKAQQQAGENTNRFNVASQPTMANNFFKAASIAASAIGGKKT
jgi:hypothetical protein